MAFDVAAPVPHPFGPLDVAACVREVAIAFVDGAYAPPGDRNLRVRGPVMESAR